MINRKGDIKMEFVRFCIVGTLSAMIDMLVFNLCRFFMPYQLCAVAGFAVSYLFNYILTVYWTYQSKPSRRRFLGMLTIHILNLFVVRIGLLTIFVEIFGLDSRIAYIPTIAVSATVSFICIRLLFIEKNNT